MELVRAKPLSSIILVISVHIARISALLIAAWQAEIQWIHSFSGIEMHDRAAPVEFLIDM